MAYYGISAAEDGLRPAAAGGDLEAGLGRSLRDAGPDAPVVVLVHGYRFTPDRHGSDPHRSLFAFRPRRLDRKTRSWPEGLGFANDAGGTGLCVGFAWPARAAHLPSLLACGRTGFAEVYDRAGALGPRLAELVALLQRLAPGRPIDLVAHSLGARVALAALPHLAVPPGRMILLGAAELEPRVLEFLGRARGAPEIYNVTARANDLYDWIFECFVPRRGWGERAVGGGLKAAPATWIDLQLDRAEVTEWVNAQGIALPAPAARLCHWSFYTREGAFALYQAILRRRPGWDVGTLRAAACFAQEPRWSRLVPRRRLALPRLGIGGNPWPSRMADQAEL